MADIVSFFQMDEADVVRIMEAADTDKNGFIDYSEFLTAAYDKHKLITEPNLRKVFNLFDADGDGCISCDEIKKVFRGGAVAQKDEAVWEQIMTEVDVNRDGLISYDEFKNAMFDVLDKRAYFNFIGPQEVEEQEVEGVEAQQEEEGKIEQEGKIEEEDKVAEEVQMDTEGQVKEEKKAGLEYLDEEDEADEVPQK